MNGNWKTKIKWIHKHNIIITTILMKRKCHYAFWMTKCCRFLWVFFSFCFCFHGEANLFVRLIRCAVKIQAIIEYGWMCNAETKILHKLYMMKTRMQYFVRPTICVYAEFEVIFSSNQHQSSVHLILTHKSIKSIYGIWTEKWPFMWNQSKRTSISTISNHC